MVVRCRCMCPSHAVQYERLKTQETRSGRTYLPGSHRCQMGNRCPLDLHVLRPPHQYHRSAKIAMTACLCADGLFLCNFSLEYAHSRWISRRTRHLGHANTSSLLPHTRLRMRLRLLWRHSSSSILRLRSYYNPLVLHSGLHVHCLRYKRQDRIPWCHVRSIGEGC